MKTAKKPEWKFRVTGRVIRKVEVAGEDFCRDDPSKHVEELIARISEEGVRGDLLTVIQRLPDLRPSLPHVYEMDNVAAVPIGTFDEWFLGRLNQHTRRSVRLAAKRGLSIEVINFDDEFARGISEIYNETPVRQGRRFRHYGKAFDAVKSENGTYLERSHFIGAYDGKELVGFLKMVEVGGYSSIMQILAKVSHFSKKPMNALLAKAVEICCGGKSSHLLYRKYVYRKGIEDSMTEFKRRNGFDQIDLPRYFIPLTPMGRIGLKTGFHRSVAERLPKWAISSMREYRNKVVPAMLDKRDIM